MKKRILLPLLMICFLLGSCVEIIDDLSFNLDGSGTLRYSINLSSSKVKLNSILALDSLDGMKIPTREEISQKIADFKQKLENQEGISGVEVETDFSNYMFKLKCNFENAEKLQNGIKNVVATLAKNKDLDELKHDWLSWNNNELKRSIPEITMAQAKKIKTEDVELLKKGSYTSITRFQTEVEKFDNDNAVLSKNKMAVMIKTDPNSLINNAKILDNRIYLNK